MARLRRFLIATAVLAAFAGVTSSRALSASLPPPPCGPQSAQQNAVMDETPSTLSWISSPHFTVWYNDNPKADTSNYITETQAGDLAGFAEQNYASFAALGFPTPQVDPSGKIDIYVVSLAKYQLSSAACYGSFYYDSGSVGKEGELIGTGWNVFVQIENKLYVPGLGDSWLTAAAAQWAAAKVAGYPAASIADIGPSGMALDCWDDTNGTMRCSTSGYENLGLSRWTFFEYLGERFGTLFVDEILNDAWAAGSSYTGLANALLAHGTNFTDVFNAWTTTEITGGYGASALQALQPTTYQTVPAGVKAGTIASSIQVPVDHMATRYIKFTRGDGTTTGVCFAATLSLSVTIPAGTLSQPMFYWTTAGSSPVPLSINGSTASASIPWDTCTWNGPVGLLSLPNASTNVNGANFAVSASMTVDLTQPVTPTLPPLTVPVNTPVVQVPTADAPPVISVFGPQLVKIAVGDRQLRLIVQSSGDGSLQAAIGSVSLGSAGLRAGNNDVRFTIPQGILSALRRSAGTSVLTLTPVSPAGSIAGQAVTRTVSITQAAPATTPTAKAKAKAAVKAKAKAKGKAKVKAKAKAKKSGAHK